MKELLRALRPVKNRLRLGRLLWGAGAGFAAGTLLALILLTVTAFVPLEGRWLLAGALAAGCTLAAAAVNALRPVKDLEAARAADGCGLRERTVTALEIAGKPAEGRAAEIAEIQRQDACAHLRTLDPRKIRLRSPKRLLLAGAALAVLCAGTLLIPGGGDRIAAERREIREKNAQLARMAEEAAAAEEAGTAEKNRPELRRLTEELKRELAESRDDVDTLVALDKAEKRLEQLREKTAGDAMDALAEAMRNAGMEAAAEALENGDAPGVNAELAEISAEELRKLAESLSGEAMEMAEQLARAAEQGNLSQQEIQAMQSGLGSAGQGSPLQQALSGMKASLGAGTDPQSGQSSQGGGQRPGEGSGAGTGSTNEEQQGSGGQQQTGSSAGSRPPEYKEGTYETIYDPEKVEAATRNVGTEQQQLDKDSVQIETGPGKGRLEGDVPFRQVVGEYARTEAEAAESARLTREQKQWVDEYFRRLTEE